MTPTLLRKYVRATQPRGFFYQIIVFNGLSTYGITAHVLEEHYHPGVLTAIEEVIQDTHYKITVNENDIFNGRNTVGILIHG